MGDVCSIRLVDGIPMVPLETEVLSHHGKWATGVRRNENGAIVVETDVRRAPWRSILNLPRGTKIHWADVRSLDVRELSAIRGRIVYRLTYGDG